MWTERQICQFNEEFVARKWLKRSNEKILKRKDSLLCSGVNNRTQNLHKVLKVLGLCEFCLSQWCRFIFPTFQVSGDKKKLAEIQDPGSRKTSFIIREDKFSKSTLTFGFTNINDAILRWLPTWKNPQSMSGLRLESQPQGGRQEYTKVKQPLNMATRTRRPRRWSQASLQGGLTIYWLLLLNYTSIQ